MSPGSRKSKDKKAKEPQKASSKVTGSANTGNGIPASAYNPVSGTFHTIDAAPTSSVSLLHSNGRFRNIDETDEHSLGSAVEYDSVSNNGSWSGESEDHKDKPSNPPLRQETIPGATDNDKREKIRQKNERKHQRQKERRAQELHERCCGFLMSRKLETLAQKLVAMGFSHERATMALMLNEGRVEESVSWLFDGAEDVDKHSDQNPGGGNLKIDISEEHARIAEMEIRFKCTKQEVERAVVAAEGDLEKAAENVRVMKQDPPSAPAKPEETGDPLNSNNGKLVATASQNPAARQLPRPNPVPVMHQRDERDFNYTKAAVTVGLPTESVNKNVQPVRGIPPKLEWAKPQQVPVPSEKRWSGSGSNSSLSYSLASPLQVSPPPAKTETRYVGVGSEYKIFQPGTVREPVVMMQRPQSVNIKQLPATSMSSSSGAAVSWYPSNGVESVKSNGFMPHFPNTRSLSPNNLSSNQMYHPLHYQQQQHFAPSGSSPGDSPGSGRVNGLWSRTGPSSSIAAASSLGLFCGVGSTISSGASSPVDWSTGGSMAHLDYTSVDWSLDRSISAPGPGGLWLGGPASSVKNTQMYDSNINGLGIKTNMRLAPTNGNAIPVMGFQDGGVPTADTTAGGSQEWTSPFEGKDLFSLPRRFVSSPSL